MDNKTMGIAVLTLTAVVLLVANVLIGPAAEAQVSVKDRDYQMVTARVQGVGDAVYIVDSRTGLMAVFAYDAGTQSVRPQAVRPVAEAFVPRQ